MLLTKPETAVRGSSPHTTDAEVRAHLRTMTASWIIEMQNACTAIGISPEIVRSKNRTQAVALARHYIAYRIYTSTKLSMAGIGRLLNKDHSSILHGIHRMERMHAEFGSIEALEQFVTRTWKGKCR